jgi:pilus assembly protein CpaF
MGLIDRLQSDAQQGPAATGPSLFPAEKRQQAASSLEDAGKDLFQALKVKIQDLLLKKIDVTRLEEAGYGPLLSQVNAVIDELVAADHLLLAETDRERLIEATTSDMLGLGPLEPLLQDNEISDIKVTMYHA